MRKKYKVKGKALEIVWYLKEFSIEGRSIQQIREKIGTGQRNVYKHLTRLLQEGFVAHTYANWKITKRAIALFQGESLKSATLPLSSEIQAHDVSFVVRPPSFPVWWGNRENKLRRVGVFRKVQWGQNAYVQGSLGRGLLQCYPSSIVFFNQEKYWGADPYDCFLQAVRYFLESFAEFEQKVQWSFFPEGVPCVSVRSTHYVKLRDVVAERCKHKGQYFEVVIDGKVRLYVDMSDPLGMEAGHKNFGIEDMQKYQRYVSDIVRYNPPTNSELAKATLQNAENLDAYAVHLRAHVASVQKLGVAVEELVKIIKELKK